MPGPIDSKPAEPTQATPEVVASSVAAENPGSVTASEGTEISTSMAGSVAIPHVAYEKPRIHGQKPTDRGEDSEFVVLHTRFGRFVQGSRITRDDISESSDLNALIDLGAIAPIGPDGEPLSPEQLNAMKAEFEAAQRTTGRPKKNAK